MASCPGPRHIPPSWISPPAGHLYLQSHHWPRLQSKAVWGGDQTWLSEERKDLGDVDTRLDTSLLTDTVVLRVHVLVCPVSLIAWELFHGLRLGSFLSLELTSPAGRDWAPIVRIKDSPKGELTPRTWSKGTRLTSGGSASHLHGFNRFLHLA